MGGVRVVTDSACDLPSATLDALGVRMVPLTIRFGADQFVDREQLSSKEFWDRVVTSAVVPETAAPSPGAFQAAFEAAADDGAEAVVCVTLSSELSATHQSATTAARAVEGRVPVSVFDSQSVTVGQGLMVLDAAEAAAAGEGAAALVERLESARRRHHVFGVLGGLDYLKKGGRIGGASHLMGSLLSIKPVIEVADGKVDVESKQRTRARAVQYLADKVLGAGPLDRLAVANGRADDLDEVLALVASARPAHDLIVSDLGPVVGSHAGPGTVGMAFLTAP